MSRQLRDFCIKHSVVTLSPDKGKGWVLVEKIHITSHLKDFIGENFTEVTSKTDSDEQYLTYRENRVRRAVTRLRDKMGTKDPAVSKDTITNREYTDANTQASRLGQHIPLAKIHKFPWLLEKHGDGIPLASHYDKLPESHNAPPNSTPATEPFGKKLKYRFVNPLKSPRQPD